MIASPFPGVFPLSTVISWRKTCTDVLCAVAAVVVEAAVIVEVATETAFSVAVCPVSGSEEVVLAPVVGAGTRLPACKSGDEDKRSLAPNSYPAQNTPTAIHRTPIIVVAILLARSPVSNKLDTVANTPSRKRKS
jgi:hypothetical protein